jgi:cell division septum initiation protein DivIVA
MTKNQELQTVRDAIDKLGNNSYLGPFLREQLPFFESALRSDMIPTRMSEAVRMADDTVAEARKTAQNMIENAMREANSIVEKARQEREMIRQQLRFKINRIQEMI